MATIDMQAMRYINLLDRVSRVRTSKCFFHNNTLFFAVDPKLVSRAIGPAAENIKKLQQQVGKKIKIIKDTSGIWDCKRFIESIVSPVKFKSLEIKDNTVIITAGNNQNKASLIGRDKRRFSELKKIIQDVFGLELKIV
jgi:transcription antitermination factor NusA-like protein